MRDINVKYYYFSYSYSSYYYYLKKKRLIFAFPGTFASVIIIIYYVYIRAAGVGRLYLLSLFVSGFRRNPSGKWVILVFSGQKPFTRIIWTISHSFLHFSKAIDVITIVVCNNTKEKFLMSAWEQNDMLHLKCLECACVLTIFLKIGICFPGPPWEIVFSVNTDN